MSVELNRVNWLDQEITRYRDYEWKITSFYAAFFTAILFILLDSSRREFMISLKWPLLLAVLFYWVTSCTQLLFVHLRLNKCRNQRSELLEKLGLPDGLPKIVKMGGFYEGKAFMFTVSFIISLSLLALSNIILVLYPLL